ncbi:hypothetical protein EW146_g2402 [Bondarzewia mesenterica]|uniref:Uncharacterized protein n=1 Tax=Bondarzewia mesenterica TaxID=1095465 RepID=A0A4S4M1A4_9AGAM|nr:hypothetical protein EW146_g2402 [Bondarzewia mesenterica]
MLHLYAAGSNAHGQLATSNCDDAHIFTPCTFAGFLPGALPSRTESILHIAGGGNHSLALLSHRTTSESPLHTELWGCGSGLKGELGSQYLREAGDKTAVFRPICLPLEEHGLAEFEAHHIAACWETSFIALKKEGESDVLISMGGDDFGDLGIGGKGKEPAKPFHVVNFMPVIDSSVRHVYIMDIVAGPHHVIVRLRGLKDNGSSQEYLTGWGTSRHGQLGRIMSKSGHPIPFLTTPRVVHLQDDSGEIAATALGNQHSILLHPSRRVSGLGSDKKGQIRDLPSVSHAISIGCTWNGTYLLVDDVNGGSRTLLSAGSHARGQLGRHPHSSGTAPSIGPVEFPSTLATFWRLHRFVCGSEHVLALFSGSDSLDCHRDTEVWGWGWNEHGNLGLGTLQDVHVPVRIWPPSDSSNIVDDGQIVGMWAGCGTSWIAVAHANP